MKMKKTLSGVLAFAMLLCISSSACAVNQTAKELGEWALEEEAAAEILDRYAAELALVEEEYGVSIDTIDSETSPMIRKVANKKLSAPEFRFQELMDSMIQAYGEQEIAQAKLIAPHTNDEKIENLTTRIVVPYGPISGQMMRYAPAGVSETDTVEVNVEAGFNVGGYGLTTATSAKASYSTTVHGPNTGDTLFNGFPAGRRYLVGVMYGAVRLTEWDLVSRKTGKVLSHHTMCSVDESQKNIEDISCFGALIPDTGELYVDSGNPSYKRTGLWAHSPAFKESVKEEPRRFLEGLGG